jgi:hypothetical protein
MWCQISSRSSSASGVKLYRSVTDGSEATPFPFFHTCADQGGGGKVAAFGGGVALFYLCCNFVAIFAKPKFLIVEHVNGSFQEFLCGLVGALDDVLLDESFEFRLDLDRHTCTLAFSDRHVNNKGNKPAADTIGAMAVHQSPGDLVIDVVSEYLEAASLCIQMKKADGGCLGVPATLLLFCVIEVIGHALNGDTVFLDGKRHQIRSKSGAFVVLNHKLFGMTLTLQQIKRLEACFRNLPAHNALIGRDSGIFVGLSEGEPFLFGEDGTVGIVLRGLLGIVSDAWSRLDRGRIHGAAATCSNQGR